MVLSKQDPLTHPPTQLRGWALWLAALHTHNSMAATGISCPLLLPGPSNQGVLSSKALTSHGHTAFHTSPFEQFPQPFLAPVSPLLQCILLIPRERWKRSLGKWRLVTCRPSSLNSNTSAQSCTSFTPLDFWNSNSSTGRCVNKNVQMVVAMEGGRRGRYWWQRGTGMPPGSYWCLLSWSGCDLQGWCRFIKIHRTVLIRCVHFFCYL